MAYLPGLGRELLKAAANAPFLEREEEKQLALNWRDQGDRHALHKLTSAHMRLVIALATKFRHYGLPLTDLVQEGHVGLLEAAARFTPERDVRFSTYATWWIRQAITRAIADQARTIRIPVHMVETINKLLRTQRRLTQELNREPTNEEIAACMPYLRRQIALIRPQVIVALGKTAAVALLGVPAETSLSSLRGAQREFGGIPLVITYHPAYLLRQPADKAKAWRDLCLAKRIIDGN